MRPTWFGKYRGTVSNNLDPNGLGRVQVQVPAVLGDGQLSWALPCMPFAGSQVGMFVVPPVGANVWVEFEGGDTDSPIWTGCFWNTGDVPASPAIEQVKMFKTDCVTVTIDDTPGGGGVTIEINPPAVSTAMKLAFTSSGIELSNGAAKITLSPATVSVNDGALEVT